MKLLLDTHILIWSAAFSHKLPAVARDLIGDKANDLMFSAVSIWEIAIKADLGRTNWRLEASQLRRNLLDRRYDEIAITGLHGVAVGLLPQIHRDPFDRMLVAQANVEGALLLTSDKLLARYPGSIHLV